MIELPETTYEDLPFFTPEIAKKNPVTTIVEPAPHTAVMKSGPSAGQTKLIITVETAGKKKYVWFANNKSAQFLVKKYGNDEGKWLNKKLETQVLEQVVSGELRDVTYAKGAMVKKESGRK